MAKLVLNMKDMQDDFFADTAMIGIATAMPGYHFCWVLNNHFDIGFERDPEQNISSQKKENQYHFPIYQYAFPNSSYKYMLYKLKNGAESLLPETKQLDYLWVVQTADPECDAREIALELKNIPDIQFAQIITTDQLKKSIQNLLV